MRVRWTSESPDEDATGGEIDFQIAGLKDRRFVAVLCLCGVPQGDTNSGEQLAGAERLDEIVVGSVIQGGDFLCVLAADRENDNRRCEPVAEFAEHFLAVHVGQAEIENDDIGWVLSRDIQGVLAGASFFDAVSGTG